MRKPELLRLILKTSAPPALGALAGAVLGGWGFGEVGAVLGAALGAGATAFARVGAAVRRPGAGEPRLDRDADQAVNRGGEFAAGYGRYLLDQVPVGILLIDRRGRVQLINPAAARSFGRHLPGPFHMSALRAPRLLEGIETALERGQAASVAFGVARAGTSQLRASIQPLSETPEGPDGGDAPALLVIVQDESQPRRAAELHRDFVANASHELKTPLASISGIIETLTGHARDDPEATERFLGLMAAQVERMKRLVEDLLSLNRIELNERIRPDKPQSLPRIVWDAAQSLQPAAEKAEMRLLCDPPAETPRVLGDRQELMQLFSNLIDNAIKYGRPGTDVAVRLHDGRPGDARVGVSVTDQGAGIAREHLPRLTERFYRVSASHSRAKGGTGLGLAIVKHIVSRHRGELKIESSPGEGSTFTVWLPVHRAESSNPGAAPLEESGTA